MSSTSDDMESIAPKAPASLYPDVPWWAVLVTAFVFAIAGIMIGIYIFKSGISIPGAKPLTGSSIVLDTISYMPHILLLFGVLADMFTLDGVWSIPSLIGILSIFANYVFQYFWKGIEEFVKTGKETVNKGLTGSATEPAAAPAAPTGGKKLKGGDDPIGLTPLKPSLFKNYNGCEVQGFGSFSHKYAPQTLVVTATVFSYYCFDLVRNRGWINSMAAIMAFITAFIGQIFVIDMQTSDTNGCGGYGTTATVGGTRALFEGLLFGGIGYGIVQTYAPTRLPSSTISPFPRKSLSDLSPGPDGKMYDADGYPYVVLPNGQAVPDVSDASARAAFGQMANKAAGSTTTLSSDCPAVKSKCPA